MSLSVLAHGNGPSLLVGVLLVLVPAAACASVETPPLAPIHDSWVNADVQREVEADGQHWRFETRNGPVHVWRPRGYRHRTAGIVVYVHGYYNTVDECWRDHGLAEQFARSSRNAIFIVPEAPIANEDPVRWEDLGTLIDMVAVRTRLRIPHGPLVVAGHSGAIRTLRDWLSFETIDEIILLDALYAFEDDLLTWLEIGGHEHVRLIMVSCETAERSQKFIEQFPYARQCTDVPDSLDQFTTDERESRVLYLFSQEGHMEIVTNGKTMPLLLQLTSIGER